MIRLVRDLGPMLRSLGRRRGSFALVVLEMTSGFTIISCLLMASAWYLDVGAVASGHDEQDLIRVGVQVAASSPEPEKALADARSRRQQELAALRSQPGVMSVAPVSASMMDGTWGWPLEVSAGPPGRPPRQTLAWAVDTETQLPQVLGLRFLEGGAGDLTGDRGGVVITRCLRERLLPPGGSARGAVLDFEDGGRLPVRAVVEDFYLRQPLLTGAHCGALRFDGRVDERQVQYLVRTAPGQRSAVLPRVAAALGPPRASRLVVVEAFDPAAGLHTTFVRGLVVILGIIVVTVGLLALLGALAVSSFLVAERTRQIGVRRALGATRGDIVRYFLLENAVATLLGTAIGLALTLALYQVMKGIFVGIRLPPGFLIFTAGLLCLEGLLAALVPARRAARIPPSVASRAT